MRTISIFATLFLHLTLSAQVNFPDISAQAGIAIDGRNVGVAIGDYDNDGDEDIYLSRLYTANILYQNNGDNTFTDVAFLAGVAFQGNTYVSTWGDLDNDGDLDLYLGNINQPNKLYRNNGDGTFKDISFPAGIGHSSKPRSVLFADVDRDGFLDIYLANLLEENVLYHNNGDLTFTDITETANVKDDRISMGAIFFDYDNDDDIDLYLTHDADQPNILYQNDGTGHFTDVSVAANADHESNGMGVDVADVNHDGFLDIYITNLSYNTLLLNQGDGTFTDVSQQSGATDTGMGWGTNFFDFNNDSYEDIYMVNDSRFTPAPNVLYENNGDLTFTEVSENQPIASMGASYGSAIADFDQDGRLDVFVANQGDEGNQLFKNDCAVMGNYLKVKLTGTTSNRSAIGSRVTLRVGTRILLDEVIAGSGYSSQNSLTLHFGLDTAEKVDEMTIRWANGLVEQYYDIYANQLVEVIENESLSTSIDEVNIHTTPLKIYPNPVTTQLYIHFILTENSPFDLVIFNASGQVVKAIANEPSASGEQQFRVNNDLPKGIYFLKLTTKKGTVIKKINF